MFWPTPIPIMLWGWLFTGSDLGECYSHREVQPLCGWLVLWEKPGESPNMTLEGREGPALQTEDNGESRKPRLTGWGREAGGIRGQGPEHAKPHTECKFYL